MKNNTPKYFIIILLTVLTFSSSQAKENFSTVEEKIEYYKQRYNSKCVGGAITDNYGNKFEELYGTRNMKPILHGIAYRGGANNYYHKSSKRKNRNPLPKDGLQNLLDEGFSKAVYLYTTNFSSAMHRCIDKSDTLNYLQISGNTDQELREILLIIKNIASNPNEGPVYLHCWNGWHQSGLVAAVILMQFCDYTNQEALRYWLDNAHGGEKGYDHIKNRISNFRPYGDISLPDEVSSKACPCK